MSVSNSNILIDWFDAVIDWLNKQLTDCDWLHDLSIYWFIYCLIYFIELRIVYQVLSKFQNKYKTEHFRNVLTVIT